MDWHTNKINLTTHLSAIPKLRHPGIYGINIIDGRRMLASVFYETQRSVLGIDFFTCRRLLKASHAYSKTLVFGFCNGDKNPSNILILVTETNWLVVDANPSPPSRSFQSVVLNTVNIGKHAFLFLKTRQILVPNWFSNLF